jgi:capsular polysaccharide transport system permease protein
MITPLADQSPPTGSLTFRGLVNQARTIGALILREIGARYGRENIGSLWMIGEPMMFASVITLVHLNQPTHYASDIQVAPFAIVGYSIFIIFRGLFNRAEGAVESNQPLLYHRRISIFDIVVARAVPEVVGCATTLFVLLGIAILTGYAMPPYRPLHLLAAIALMVWWAFGLTLIAASITYRSETFSRQIHIISYFSVPVSGAFFQLSWLPYSMREAFSWFPMALIFEQARYGQFRTASAEYVDPAYVIAWCAGLTYIGLALIRRVRYRVYG